MDYYHVFNRGAHKQNIFRNRHDMFRFLDGLVFFNDANGNSKKMIHTALKNRRNQTGLTCLVTIHAYCLLPNHFHLLVSCEEPSRLSKFMQKLGSGYSGYFNEKYEEHSGTIFQGTYKKVQVESEEHLFQLLAYINGNYLLHDYDHNITLSSMYEYFVPQENVLGSTELVSDNFISQEEFFDFCNSKIQETKQQRKVSRLIHLID